MEDRDGWARHENMPVLTPCDAQVSAIHRDRAGPFYQAAADGIYDGGTGSRSTGERQASATLPDAQAHVCRGEDLRETDIGAFREEGISFEVWPQFFRAGGVTEQRGVWISHRAGCRIMQWQMQGVTGPGHRHVLPVQPGHAHIDCEEIAILCRGKKAGGRLERRSATDELRHAARCIAAGPGFRTVRVEETDMHVCPCQRRRRQQDKLVAADSEAPVAQMADRRGIKGGIVLAAVDHDEIVAQTVHFREGEGHDGASHKASCGLTHGEHALISAAGSEGVDMSGPEQLEGMHAAAFTRANSEPDTIFYAQRVPDSLMDMGARTAVTALYQTALPVGGAVLDLMAGALSHYPEEATFQRVVGLGISKGALDSNPVLGERVVQDLNEVTTLPFEDDSFDAVTLCDGLAYLTQPLAVLTEVVRVLKPGAPLILTFSDQFHAVKAVAIWQALEPADRVRLASVLMSRAGLAELDTGEVVPPEDLTAWRDTVHAVIGRKPRN